MTFLGYIKELVSPTVRLLVPYFTDFWRFLVRSAGMVASVFRRLWRAIKSLCSAAFAWFIQIPSAVKVYMAMIVFLLCFLLWQLLAYDFPQTTFVTVNLAMVTTISVLVFRLMFRNVRRFREAASEAADLREDKARLTEEVRELKGKIYELLSRGNRQQRMESSGRKLYEMLFPQGSGQVPEGEKVLASMSRLFEMTGGISFRREEAGERYVIDGKYALSADPGEAVVTADDPFAGQAIADRRPIEIADVPAEYLTALSGLGESTRLKVHILPLVIGDEVVSLTEVASFREQDIAQVWEEMLSIVNKKKVDDSI